MTYTPPIKKRNYLKNDGKTHHCAKCDTAYPLKSKGVWFEGWYRTGVWFWVCQNCVDKRRGT